MNNIYQDVLVQHKDEIGNIVSSLEEENMRVANVERLSRRKYHIRIGEGVDVLSGHDNNLRRAVDILCGYDARLVLDREKTIRDRYPLVRGEEPIVDCLVQSDFLINLGDVYVHISYEERRTNGEQVAEDEERDDLDKVLSEFDSLGDVREPPKDVEDEVRKSFWY